MKIRYHKLAHHQNIFLTARVMNPYVLIALWLGSLLPIWAAPLDPSTEKSHSFIADSRVLNGQSALQAGLPSISELFFLEALEENALSYDLREKASLGIVDAYLAQHKILKASSFLATWELQKTPRYQLRAALCAYAQGKWEKLSLFLRACSEENLPSYEHAWLFLLQALEAMHNGHPMAAMPLLEKAKNVATNPTQRAWIETIITENKLLSEPVDETLLKELKLKTDTYRGQAVGARFTEEYALALAASGHLEEALGLLNKELKRLPSSAEAQETHLLFLIGYLSKNTEEAIQSFKRILTGKRSIEAQRMALYTLANLESPDAFEKTLNQLIEGSQAQALLGDCLLLRAALNLSKKQWDRAEADGKKALTLSQDDKTRSLSLLATLSWERGQFRSAADYLSQWKQSIEDMGTQAYLSGWMGDCYFRLQDYGQAQLLYLEALSHAQANEKNRLIYQLVLTYIQEGKLQEAASFLDQQPPQGIERWRAEWNLLQALKQGQQAPYAYERIRLLKAKPDIPETLRYRFDWLEAMLALDRHNYAEAVEKATALVRTLKEPKEESLLADEYALLLSEALLLQAEALLALKSPQEANICLDNLRQDFPESTAAPRSYLIEARIEASSNHMVEAQQKFIELADRYPLSAYAPIALFEAAVVAENRGTTQATQEALVLLERLVSEYPNHELIYAARMEQGKLLCHLGDFGAAQLLYTTLIPTLHDRPERYLVMLAKADCLLAQAEADPIKRNEAMTLLERISDQSSLPARLRYEAAYKWGFALESQKNTQRAITIYWELLTPLMKQPGGLDNAEAYWVARTAFALAHLLEQQGKPVEAQKLYQLIINKQLPGYNLALNRLRAANPL